MDQVEVQVVQAKVLQRSLTGQLCPFIAGILHPQLRGDKQFLPIRAALTDARSHGLLIAINGGGVNHPIARAYRFADGADTLAAIGVHHAQTHQRHLHSVAQDSRFLDCCFHHAGSFPLYDHALSGSKRIPPQ